MLEEKRRPLDAKPAFGIPSGAVGYSHENELTDQYRWTRNSEESLLAMIPSNYR